MLSLTKEHVGANQGQGRRGRRSHRREGLPHRAEDLHHPSQRPVSFVQHVGASRGGELRAYENRPVMGDVLDHAEPFHGPLVRRGNTYPVFNISGIFLYRQAPRRCTWNVRFGHLRIAADGVGDHYLGTHTSPRSLPRAVSASGSMPPAVRLHRTFNRDLSMPRVDPMKIVPFEMERWQSTWENAVEYNLSESGVQPIPLRELLRDEPAVDRFLGHPLAYSQGNGTPELRTRIATQYQGATQDHVLGTNGSSEANLLAMWHLVEKGDEV